MTELFIWWCVIGLVSGILASVLSYCLTGHVTVIDVVAPIVMCWLGPILTVALVVHYIAEMDWDWTEKKIYERKK